MTVVPDPAVGRLQLRPAAAADLPLLRAMLIEAAFWRDASPPVARSPEWDAALARPDLAVYLDDWGRHGDRGVVADLGGAGIAAAWLRLFTPLAHGYGFVDEETPEITIAVAAPRRGVGVGHALLATIVAQARIDGHAALSLSVEDDNPARRLYVRLGFAPVGRVGGSDTMVLHLAGGG